MRVQSRDDLAHAKTIIVKIGSALLADPTPPTAFERVAADVGQLKAWGHDVIVVSSGAIALGLGRLRYESRPTDLAGLQAAAAAGQGLLQRMWDEAFARHGHVVAQVLLTHGDLQNRKRFLNAQAALRCLLERGAIPIVNENDTVSVAEIKLGDNDTLAAQICGLVDAEVVVLLTSADGLRTADPHVDPNSERISVVHDIADVEGVAKGPHGPGTGGMRTKLEAARIARAGGAATIIAPGIEPQVVTRLVQGEDIGTLVVAGEAAPISARKRWLTATIRPMGTLVVDTGARQALVNRGASLLAAGVLEVRGEFVAQDPIQVQTADGVVFAQGLAAVSARQIQLQAGKSESEMDDDTSPLVIHRDDLVVLDGDLGE